jgi:hypothetical protein
VEAAGSDPGLATGLRAIRERFDALAACALAATPGFSGDADEVAHALNLMNEAYLLDAFGREPRLEPARARAALSAIWSAVLR